MAKSGKKFEKAAVKIEDMAPAKDAKGGADMLTTTVTNLANMRHEMLKAVAQNLRG